MRKSEALRYRRHIETAVQSLPVNKALEVPSLHPKWDAMIGKTVEEIGFRFSHGDKLYATKQPDYTFMAHWVPGATGTESLFEEVNETNAGTLDDPIPYDGNMALTSGLYYSQADVVYLCTRDTGNPVYHALSELVGVYVEVVE